MCNGWRCVTTRARPRAVAVLAAFLTSAVALNPARTDAQESSEGTFELALWKRLSATDMLYVPISLTRDGEVDHLEGLAGASYDRVFNQTLSARAGYRYLWELSPVAGTTPYREHRAVTEMSARTGDTVALVDRTRLELRWIDGAHSWRLRNRLRAEREFALKRLQSLTPYGTFEGTYDSRYHTVNRLRFTLGAATRFSSWLMLDTYVARQRDSRSDGGRLQALGMTLNLTL